MRLFLIIVFSFSIFCLIAIFAAANSDLVSVNLLFTSVTLSLRWIMFSLFSFGLLFGLVLSFFAVIRYRLIIRRLRKQIEKLPSKEMLKVI